MKQITPNEASTQGKKEQVQSMFDAISSTYDKGNRFISLGLDQTWKNRLVKIVLSHEPKKILDLATGTADLPIRMVNKGLTNITGLDLSHKMLAEGQKRLEAARLTKDIQLQQGDSENLPFADDAFDAVTVSYGLRNYEDLDKGLRETYRVLKPGGVFVILETSVPQRFPIKQCYRFFTSKVMPMIGGLMSGNREAYAYLSKSAENFPCGNDLVEILNAAGFSKVKAKPQFFGAASLYVCFKTNS